MRRSAGRRVRKNTKTSIWAALGSKGGRARAKRLSARERRRIAMLGVQARLAKRKIKKLRAALAGEERGAVRIRVANAKVNKRKKGAGLRRK